jgi:hypothetical protein
MLDPTVLGQDGNPFMDNVNITLKNKERHEKLTVVEGTWLTHSKGITPLKSSAIVEIEIVK